eukprot:TRINITY_DN238_c0_g1_i1.p2 TRINITY_DN238_c0_g1~~TRINITY_DN238_c0_g1_i1.p2  ORF type:complete len:732 (-),score=202.81 TRINITY_DN238_c0_g1_i1:483-2678(-)
MRKQRKLTSFFRPLGAPPRPASAATPPRKRPAPAATPTNANKRPRAASAPPTATKAHPPRSPSAAAAASPKNANEPPPAASAPVTATKAQPPLPYAQLADAFSAVEALSGRLHIQAVLSSLFARVLSQHCAQDLLPLLYLCVNKLAPAHHGVELGVGDAVVLKALSTVSGRSLRALRHEYQRLGDLGDVAFASRTTQKTMFPPPPLSVRAVYQQLCAIARMSGRNAQQHKLARIVNMLVAASKREAKYLARALSGKLRIHLADKSVIAALAAAVVLRNERVTDAHLLLHSDGSKKSKLSVQEQRVEQLIKHATARLNAVYCRLPVWDAIVPKLVQFGAIDERLEHACQLSPGVPVSPMLAKPSSAIAHVLQRFAHAPFTCEYKYDGERAQIHRLHDGSVSIYSRNAENLTPKYPELVQLLPLTLKAQYKHSSFVIDSEAVAYDVARAKILPFQELQSRKRKNVQAHDIKVKVCIFAFDLLYFDGQSLIERPLQQRRALLRQAFDSREGQFMFARGRDLTQPEHIMELLNASVKEGCEGLMVKALDGDGATYEPANRSQNWLKVKKDYLEGCGDSLDLVPIGAYRGRGKRTGAYGAFLLACYDADKEEFQSVCKIGTGFSEAQLEQFASYFNEEGAARTSDSVKSYYRVRSVGALQPDVWLEATQVWEVKCADLSLSPQHMAGVGRVDADKGVALRFPRFVRVREDKTVEQATSAEQVVDMYLSQSAVGDDG